MPESWKNSRRMYRGYARRHRLGFAHEISQRTRFAALVRHVATAGRTVLDFGCGHADLYPFLCESGQQPARYHGTDLLPQNLALARQHIEHYMGRPRSGSSVSVSAKPAGRYDVVCALSVLAVDEGPRTLELWRATLDDLWARARQALVFDLLRVEPGYPHPGHRRLTPVVIAEIAAEMSRNHVIDNSIADHYSFIVLRREPTPTRRFWDSRR
jgi:hypothetical protein